MNDGKSIFTNLVLDVLLALSLGFLISILSVLFTVGLVGPEFSLKQIASAMFQIFSPNQWAYDQTSRDAFLFPIAVSTVGVLSMRRFIQAATTRKSWFVVTIAVGVIALFTGVLLASPFIGYGGFLWIVPSLLSVMSLTGAICLFIAFLTGMFLGVIYAPQRLVVKTLTASVTAALVGALFEILVLGLALYEAF